MPSGQLLHREPQPGQQRGIVHQQALLRAEVAEAYEAVAPLDRHADLIRAILVEVSLLAERYRNVRRHDVPHVAELCGLLDVLWQEVEMVHAVPRGLLEAAEA